ncbi:hypothetical protein HGM15179_005353 [Zosterops borbonicus]|uniref:Uncharacterized protein n=1 Tax=Zosterops borbonicus TaxID=364589 RepID=A0A8K1GMJ3_9PASS|nr:hypothetical protein HGM15179_005353 [Zosterops borbonicus]
MEWRLRRKKQLREKEKVVEIQHFSSRSGSPEGCLVMVGWHMLAFLCLQYNAIILRDREGELSFGEERTNPIVEDTNEILREMSITSGEVPVLDSVDSKHTFQEVKTEAERLTCCRCRDTAVKHELIIASILVEPLVQNLVRHLKLIMSRKSKCFTWILGVLCQHIEKCDSILSTLEQEFCHTFVSKDQALSIPED